MSPGLLPADDELSWYAAQARELVAEGDYAEAEEYCLRLLRYGSNDPNVVGALIESQQAVGKYEEAARTASAAARSFEGYFPIQVQAIGALRAGGKTEEARTVLAGLNTLAKEANPKTLNATELVALGEAALLLGGEPKMVLGQFFQKARQLEPNLQL